MRLPFGNKFGLKGGIAVPGDWQQEIARRGAFDLLFTDQVSGIATLTALWGCVSDSQYVHQDLNCSLDLNCLKMSAGKLNLFASIFTVFKVLNYQEENVKNFLPEPSNTAAEPNLMFYLHKIQYTPNYWKNYYLKNCTIVNPSQNKEHLVNG